MAQYQPQYGYPVSMVGGSPQPQQIFLQPSPQANVVPLPNVQYIPSPSHVVSALPQQGGQYVMQASPSQPVSPYFSHTPIVPMAALPAVQYTQVQTQPTPHYALASSNNPLVMWDIFQSPQKYLRATSSQFPIYLNVPATEPASTSMRIICKEFPWMITIKKREGVVTVGDVFDAIHQQLAEPIIHSEWRLMGGSAQKKVTQRFTQRMELLKSMGEPEDTRGIRRVDFVLNRTAFVGIKQDSKTISELVGDIDIPNAWLLVLGERSR